MLFRFARAVRHYPSRPLAAITVLLLLAWLAGRTDQLAHLHRLALTAAAGLFALTTLFWYDRRLGRVWGVGDWVGRRDEASQHAGGVATWTDIGEHAGPTAMRRRVGQLRPSLARRNWLVRRFTPVSEYAVLIARTGRLPFGNAAYSSCEDVTVRFGGPRSGKTGSLACHALDAPGALLVTTSRTDLLRQTESERSRRGQIWVFNPTGLGEVKSTVRWSAISGCQDYATALRRAKDLIPEGPSTEGERWDEQARGLLAVLMHAAALENRRLRDVLEWVSPADDVTLHQITDALAQSPSSAALIADVRSVFTTNERTRTSITATMLPALRWLNDDTAAEVGDAHLDDPALLDVSRFVASGRDSLYLIGREGGARTLIGALTAEVAHQVRMHAAAQESGRLNPPMTALLDEAPLTCGPIPLHDWTADMGGRGFTLHIAAQSPAQLRDVWGHERAEAIVGNTATILVFGGLKTTRSLDDISTLCGTRMMTLDRDDIRPQPVMTAAQISQLPMGRALILRNGLRPIIGEAPMIWTRRPSRLRHLVLELAAAAREGVVRRVDSHATSSPFPQNRSGHANEDHGPRVLPEDDEAAGGAR